MHLALETTRAVMPDAQVLVPSFSMIACARAVSLAGGDPAFMDCDEQLLVTPDTAMPAYTQALLRSYVSAMMPVHVYGRKCDMEGIHEFAKARALTVVEDLAEAHGIRPHPESQAACWSFYKNKIVHGEEGGACWFVSRVDADRARSLRNLGFTPAHDFRHLPRGHNYRLANLLAEPIRANLGNYAYHLQCRREWEADYDAACPADWKMPARQAPWVYDIRIQGMTGSEQDSVVAELNKAGIAARHSFKPGTSQLEYRGCKGNGDAARAASREVIYLPLTLGQVDPKKAFGVIRTVLGR